MPTIFDQLMMPMSPPEERKRRKDQPMILMPPTGTPMGQPPVQPPVQPPLVDGMDAALAAKLGIQPDIGTPPPPTRPTYDLQPPNNPMGTGSQNEQAALMPQDQYADTTGLQMAGARDENYRLRHTKAVNNDRGFGGRLLDVVRQAVIGAGQAYNNGSGTAEQRLYGSIGGAFAGGLQGGLDPAVDERRELYRKIGQSDQDIAMKERNQQYDQQIRQREASINSLEQSPILRQGELDRKTAADRARNDMAQRTLDFKKDDREEYYRLEQVKVDARNTNDTRTYDLAVQKQAELERANKVKEGQQAANEKGRNARAGMVNQRIIGLDAAKQYGANVKGKAEAAKAINDIRSKGAAYGAPPEEIEKRIEAYKQSLPNEYRP